MIEEPVIHVVDDDESFRAAMARLLRAAGYDVRAYDSVPALLASDPGETAGCVLADLRMPGAGGLDLQKALAEAGNPVPIVFITAHGDIPTTVRAMRDGAVDFLTKPVQRPELLRALQRALRRDARARQAREEMELDRRRLELLTPREREVLTHIIAGKLNKQVAFDLEISERTVKAHRAAIMKKLDVESVAELVRLTEALDIEPAG